MAPISEAAAVKKLWEAGTYPALKFLDRNQRKIYDHFKSCTGQYTLNCGRRTGKSNLLTVLAIEFAIQNPGSEIRLAAMTQKQVREIYAPSFRRLLKSAPATVIEPRAKKINSQGKVCFRNGSTITIAGGDPAHRENLRGNTSHLILIDEAGFIDELDDLIGSDLAPQLITTKGRLIVSSTPPITTDHPFVKLARTAQLNGRYYCSNIFEANYITDEERADYLQTRADALGLTVEEFKETTVYRREILAEFVTDQEKQAVPEWTAAREKAHVRPVAPPLFIDRYTAGDYGFSDGAGLLFAWFATEVGVLVIEDECLMRRKNPTVYCAALYEKEKELGWDGAFIRRVIDTQPGTLDDLQSNHSLEVEAPIKGPGSFLAGLGRVRSALAAGQVVIHPRCKKLIYQLQTTVLNKQRTKFAHSSDGSHSELLAALCYLIQIVDLASLTTPEGFGLTYEKNDYRKPDIGPSNDSERDLLSIFQSPFDS